MDYQAIADSYEQIAAVVSVDMNPGDTYGTIRIVAGNDLYKEAVSERGKELVPGMLYTDAMDRDLNFESLCLRCIVEKKPIHSYVNAPVFEAWLSLFYLPLRSDTEGISYCLFSYDMDFSVDPAKLADTSAESAEQVLKTCILLRESGDFNESMDSITEDIREICDADYSCILLTDFAKRECSVQSEAIRGGSGMLPMETYLDNEFFGIVETWMDTLAGSNCVAVSNVTDWQALREVNPTWADSLDAAGAKSVILYPLKSNEDVIGFFWAINFDTERTLAIKEILEATTFILSAEIANRQMFDKMEQMSRTDLLTGVYNRNAMNNRIDSYTTCSEEPFGVIFADLNCLKYTNDTSGHARGDELLKSAAEILKDIFDGYEVYRAGGDEFMVFAPGINEYEFYTRMNSLKVLADSVVDFTHVCFAVGGCYCEEGADVRDALHEADKKMYKDKERFYEKHPEILRRV